MNTIKMATCTLEGRSPLVFGGPVMETRQEGESYEQYEERTWRLKAIEDKDGIYLDPYAAKQCLLGSVAYAGEKVAGMRNRGWKSFYTAGVLCVEKVRVDATRDDLIKMAKFIPSDGRVGGGTRVWKFFPTLPEWQATVTYLVIEPKIWGDAKRFERYVQMAGDFVGFGVWAPRRNGWYGRFEVKKIDWDK